MGVMLQAFYWDCPRIEKKEFKWWKHVEKQIPALAEVGFTSLWLPPIRQHKGNLAATNLLRTGEPGELQTGPAGSYCAQIAGRCV